MDYKDLSAIDTNAVNTYLGIFGIGASIVISIFALIVLVALWKIFTKAGRPGWYALIPVFNVYIMLKIVRKPGWLTLLFFIPYLGIIPQIIISVELGKAFGKSTAFTTILLVLLPFGFFVIAFDDSKYLYGINKPPPVTPPNAYV